VINALHSFYCHNVVIAARDQLATIAWGLQRSVTEIAAGSRRRGCAPAASRVKRGTRSCRLRSLPRRDGMRAAAGQDIGPRAEVGEVPGATRPASAEHPPLRRLGPLPGRLLRRPYRRHCAQWALRRRWLWERGDPLISVLEVAHSWALCVCGPPRWPWVMTGQAGPVTAGLGAVAAGGGRQRRARPVWPGGGS